MTSRPQPARPIARAVARSIGGPPPLPSLTRSTVHLPLHSRPHPSPARSLAPAHAPHSRMRACSLAAPRPLSLSPTHCPARSPTRSPRSLAHARRASRAHSPAIDHHLTIIGPRSSQRAGALARSLLPAHTGSVDPPERTSENPSPASPPPHPARPGRCAARPAACGSSRPAAPASTPAGTTPSWRAAWARSAGGGGAGSGDLHGGTAAWSLEGQRNRRRDGQAGSGAESARRDSVGEPAGAGAFQTDPAGLARHDSARLDLTRGQTCGQTNLWPNLWAT